MDISFTHTVTVLKVSPAAEMSFAFTDFAEYEPFSRNASATTSLAFSHLAFPATSLVPCDTYTPTCLGVRSQFSFYYPVVSPTLTLNLRIPTFGNTRTLKTFVKIKRTTASHPRVTSKSTWPKIEEFNYVFDPLSETQRNDFISFITQTYGLEIKITDHENCSWSGVLVDPMVVTSQQGRGCQFKATVTFRGIRL